MKNLILGVAAAATLSFSAPAMAHQSGGEDWRVDSYNTLVYKDQRIRETIRHGLDDGSYTRTEVRYFYTQLQSIRQRAEWGHRTGRFDRSDISYRLTYLHDQMQLVHDRGHARLRHQSSYNPYRGW